MHQSSRVLVSIALAAGIPFESSWVWAQPSAETPPVAPPVAPPLSREDEARAHYDRGYRLIEAEDWAAAYAEFAEANRMFPTRSASTSAGVCLKKLFRYDEALDWFERVLREYPNLPRDVKAEALKELLELRGLVGTVNIFRSEAGSTIMVDGRFRGEYPLLSTLRLAAGSHLLRVYKEGFEPLNVTVDVAGGAVFLADGRLSPLVSGGKLRVEEQTGKVLDVLVDGTPVGQTPWQGAVAVGAHTLTLRGAEHIGALPKVVTVEARHEQTVVLVAERLDAELNVVPQPVGASVAIDSIFVSRGSWEGDIHPGKHTIKVLADGYFPSERTITVDRGRRESVKMALKKDPNALIWRSPGRFAAEMIGAFAVVPSFAGQIADCTDCDTSLAAGGAATAHIAYESWRGLGFGGTLGYVGITQTVANQPLGLNVVGVAAPDQGRVEDKLILNALRFGVWGGIRVRDNQFPIRARLGAGAIVGPLKVRRTGTYRAGGDAAMCNAGDLKCFDVGPLVESPVASYLYVAPEVRVGYRLLKQVEVSVGFEALLMFGLTTPRWNDDSPVRGQAHPVNAGPDGYGTFASEILTRSLSVALLPSIGIRYEL